MKQEKSRFGIDTFTLKMIAILSMLVDHIGAVLLPEVTVLRVIGRMAFPIFGYLLVEGFQHTRDVKKYMMRLGIVALIAEVPFDLAFYGKPFYLWHQNIFFTLLIGLVMLHLYQKYTGNQLMQSVVLAVAFVVAEVLAVDYGMMGAILIFLFYFTQHNKWMQLITNILMNVFVMGGTQMYAVLGLIPIALHNKEEGRKMKGFFYGFYPVHLLVLYLIGLVL